MTALDTLVQEQKAVAFPEQAFDPGSRPPTEQEQRIRYEQLFMERSFDDGRERVNAIPEIGVAADDVDTGERAGISVFKHSAPPGPASAGILQKRMA